MVKERTTGPQIWFDLNTKAGDKIQAYLEKNAERTSWLDSYLEECKRKLGSVTAEPTFVPKTPVVSKRTRRGRASKDVEEQVNENVAPVRASKRTSRKKSSLAQNQIIAHKDEDEVSSIEVTTEQVENSVGNATFDVGRPPMDQPTFVADSSVVSGLSTNTTESFAFIEADLIVQEQESADNTNCISPAGSAPVIVDKSEEVEHNVPSIPQPDPTPRKNQPNVLPPPVQTPRIINHIEMGEDEENNKNEDSNVLEKEHDIIEDSKVLEKEHDNIEDVNDSLHKIEKDSIPPIRNSKFLDGPNSRKSTRTENIKSVENPLPVTKRVALNDDELEPERDKPNKSLKTVSSSDDIEESIPKVIGDSSNEEDEGNVRRSTRAKQKVDQSTSKGDEDKRLTRTKKICDILTSASSAEENVDDGDANTRSSRTKTKKPAVSSSSETEDQGATRSTRTKRKMLLSQSEKKLTINVASLASPRIKELVNKAMSPATRNSSPSKVPIYVGSPIKDRVKVFEEAMRDSVGLKKTSRRKSSVAKSLCRVSAARGVQVAEVLSEQEVNVVSIGPVIRKSPGTGRPSLNNSRAPAGKVVKPGRKVLASGGRGITTPGSGSHSGSSSSNMIKSRSRLNLGSKGLPSTPSNMIGKKGGVTSFLPGKTKGPTLTEVQAQKDEERKRKEEKEAEVIRRRDELLKSKADEQREKREARIKRVQEARQKQENKDDKMKMNQEKEKEEKLALLKRREEKLKEEADKRKKETESKLKEAEERRKRDEDERLAKHERQEHEKKEIERKQEEEALKRKEKEEDERKKKSEEEKRKKVEDIARDEELRHQREQDMRKGDQKRKLEEEKKRLVAHQERIQREKEELTKMKEREALRQADLNSTYSKDEENAVNKTQILDSTASKAIQGVTSYDMTPARHELPPEPLNNEDDYGLEDLKSDQDTDDEDAPRKQIPKWAEGTNLRTTLLKQCYMGPNVDDIFETIIMPDLSQIFEQQRKRFFKRTSSACWDQTPTSFQVTKS